MKEIPYDRLLAIARKMHLWIWENTMDEQAVYSELGLTDEENALLGYLGEVRISGSPKEGDAT